MNELHPCPACRRHLRKAETSCPFCGESVSLSSLPAHPLPKRRLGRAATFAFGATVVGATALVGCEDDNGGAVAVYGGPPTAGAGGTSLGGSPVYGGPPIGGDPGIGGIAGGGTPAAGGDQGLGGYVGIGGEPSGGTSAGGAAGEAGAENGGELNFPVYGGPPAGAGNQ